MKNRVAKVLLFAFVAILATVLFHRVSKKIFNSEKPPATSEKVEIKTEIAPTATNDGKNWAGPTPLVFEDRTLDKEVTVRIKNHTYVPNAMKIRVGTKVTWINEDESLHSVMAHHGDAESVHEAPAKEDPNKLGSRLLMQGESYSFIFKTTSDNSYHCPSHPEMKGRIGAVL